MRKVFFLGLLFGLVFHTTAARAVRFDIKDPGFRNSVFWVSDALLETITGQSNFISGWVELQPEDLKAGIRGQLDIDTRTFETGAPARNTKIRESFLGSTKQPIATFTIQSWDKVPVGKLKPGKSVNAQVEGTLSANGVQVKRVIPVKVTYWKESPSTKRRLAGNLIQFRADFRLKLQDFQISIPTDYQGLIAPEVKVSTHFMGTDRTPAALPP